MNDETYLKVSEMGVEPNNPDKTYRVKELPLEKPRQEKIEGNVDFVLTAIGPDESVTDTIRNTLYLEKCIRALDMYDGWKSAAFYMAGKLSALETGRGRS